MMSDAQIGSLSSSPISDGTVKLQKGLGSAFQITKATLKSAYLDWCQVSIGDFNAKNKCEIYTSKAGLMLSYIDARNGEIFGSLLGSALAFEPRQLFSRQTEI